jgi:hypothetical protein
MQHPPEQEAYLNATMLLSFNVFLNQNTLYTPFASEFSHSDLICN